MWLNKCSECSLFRQLHHRFNTTTDTIITDTSAKTSTVCSSGFHFHSWKLSRRDRQVLSVLRYKQNNHTLAQKPHKEQTSSQLLIYSFKFGLLLASQYASAGKQRNTYHYDLWPWPSHQSYRLETYTHTNTRMTGLPGPLKWWVITRGRAVSGICVFVCLSVSPHNIKNSCN